MFDNQAVNCIFSVPFLLGYFDTESLVHPTFRLYRLLDFC